VPEQAAVTEVEGRDDHFVGRFTAMAGPCEVLVATGNRAEADLAVAIAAAEAARVERKFSRYRDDSVVHRIHAAAGAPVAVDDETRLLLDYAATCHELSAGRFDITTGVLRRAWRFDGGSRVPDDATVQAALALVGWRRVTWRDGVLTLPRGMEIDFGGIGKEYAVDRAASLVAERCESPVLVNFGGDLFATGPRPGGEPWGVGLEDPDRPGEGSLYLARGGLATSGDARRYVIHEGRRLGHILDPTTGWPVAGAPRSVTVVAASCLEAGTLSTLAYLQGPRAADFLREQGVEFRVV
jgi:thiamine biosynthesis lipoprotein